MNNAGISIDKLLALANFLEKQECVDDHLTEIAAQVARILNAKHCSIMLFDHLRNDAGCIRPRAFAHHGLPSAAREEAASLIEEIAGRAVASRSALVIKSTRHYPCASPGTMSKKMCIAAPIHLNNRAIGVIAIFTPRDERRFTREDRNLLTITTFVIGKSIEIVRMQHIFNSGFTQSAVSQETKRNINSAVVPLSYDQEKMAKILAKSFYREMTRIGFAANHIINAATEIISLLSANLARHRKRVKSR